MRVMAEWTDIDGLAFTVVGDVDADGTRLDSIHPHWAPAYTCLPNHFEYWFDRRELNDMRDALTRAYPQARRDALDDAAEASMEADREERGR